MEAIDQGIDILAKRITTSVKPEDAMKFTQAALNLAHTKSVITGLTRSPNCVKPNQKGAGT